MHREPAANNEKLSAQRAHTSWLSTQILLESMADTVSFLPSTMSIASLLTEAFSSSGTEKSPLNLQ